MAESKQDKETEPAKESQSQPVTAYEAGSGKHPKCTVEGCDKRCDVYDGDNPFKQNTMVCPEHGRMPVAKA